MALKSLSPKQIAFADAILDGMGPSAAYRHAGYFATEPQLVAVKAQEVMRSALIQKYIADGREKLERGKTLTRLEKRRTLRSIALSTKHDAGDRIRAIQVDNLMTGDNKPIRVEGELTLNTIFRSLSGSTGLPDPSEVIDLDEMAANQQPNLAGVRAP